MNLEVPRLSHEELEFLSGREFSREEIYRVSGFGILSSFWRDGLRQPDIVLQWLNIFIRASMQASMMDEY